MRRKLLPLVLLATLPALAGGETRRAAFAVSVEVVPQARLDSSRAPQSFVLEPADLARGYKEIEARYRVATRASRGYWLRFSLREGLARSVEVLGIGTAMPLGPLGGEVRQDPPGPNGRDLALRFRIQLEPSLAPGRYPLPVLVSVDPI